MHTQKNQNQKNIKIQLEEWQGEINPQSQLEAFSFLFEQQNKETKKSARPHTKNYKTLMREIIESLNTKAYATFIDQETQGYTI